MRPPRRNKSSKRPQSKRSRAKRRLKPTPRRASTPTKRPKKGRRATTAKPEVRSDRKPGSALEREVQRLRRAQSRLERRLTAAVQEIGMLRQFEMRAQALESELARRAAEIAELRREREERSRKAGNPLGGASIASTPS